MFIKIFNTGVTRGINVNRQGATVSAQVSCMGSIDINTDDFDINNGQYAFNIKNDSDETVQLYVQLAGMEDGDWVQTSFYPGWNPEIVKRVQQDDSVSADLKWGL